MAADYDASRTRLEGEPVNESLEVMQAQRSTTAPAAVIGLEAIDAAEGIDLPGADLCRTRGCPLQVIPEQVDGFGGLSCLLVRHRSQLARELNGVRYCTGCLGCFLPRSLSPRGPAT